MIDKIAFIAAQLKDARERKGLSQRALADKVGLPQGHLSRIERGDVDVQTSNLIELARALDLELVLVPRRTLPTVEALSQPLAHRLPEHGPQVSPLRQQAARLARKFPEAPVLDRLARTLSELPEPLLQTLPASEFAVVAGFLERTRRILKAISVEPEGEPLGPAFVKTVETLEEALRNLRNRIVHGGFAPKVTASPAYTLEEEDDEGPA